MHNLTAWALFASYLWILGGMGWSYQHESARAVRLSPIGRAIIILTWPVLSGLSTLVSGLASLRDFFLKKPS